MFGLPLLSTRHLGADPRRPRRALHGLRPQRRRRALAGAGRRASADSWWRCRSMPASTRAPAASSSSNCMPWIESFNVNYHLGIDGISLLLILLNCFTTVLVVLAGWQVDRERVAQYMAAFLILSGFMNGVFCALDAAAVLRVLRGDADPDVHHHRRLGRPEPRLRRAQVLPLHAARLAADAGRADLSVQRLRAAVSRCSTTTSCRFR